MKISATTTNGKPAWRVNYSVLGKQKRKFFPRNPSLRKQCTGFLAAEKFERDFHRQITNEGPTIASLSPQERMDMLRWWVRLRELGVTPQEAVDAALANRKIAPMVPQVVEECIASKKARQLSLRYIQQLGHVLKHFSTAFLQTQINRISASQIEVWIQAGNYSAASRRSRMADINTLFAFAVKRDYCEKNPCDKIDEIKVTPKTPGILTPDEAGRLMKAAYVSDRRLCAHLALALFCGIRPAELERIDRLNIMLEKHLVEVTFEMSKVTKRRTVRIPENAMEWLALPRDIPPRNLKRRFDRVRRQAGVFETWEHDAMRHSAATFLYALNGDAAETAKQMGHTVNVLLTNYNALRTPSGELVTKEMAEEFFAIKPGPMIRLLEDVA